MDELSFKPSKKPSGQLAVLACVTCGSLPLISLTENGRPRCILICSKYIVIAWVVVIPSRDKIDTTKSPDQTNDQGLALYQSYVSELTHSSASHTLRHIRKALQTRRSNVFATCFTNAIIPVFNANQRTLHLNQLFFGFMC